MEGEDLEESTAKVRIPSSNAIKWHHVDIKSLNEKLINILIEDKDEEALIQFFKNNKQPELFFMSLDTEEDVEVYTNEPDESD